MIAPSEAQEPTIKLSGNGARSIPTTNPNKPADVMDIHHTKRGRFLPKKPLKLDNSIRAMRIDFRMGASIIFTPREFICLQTEYSHMDQ
jgi:hypothetical protein